MLTQILEVGGLTEQLLDLVINTQLLLFLESHAQSTSLSRGSELAMHGHFVLLSQQGSG